jgi:hypothetical protein
MLGLIDMRDSVGKPRKKNLSAGLKLGNQFRSVSGAGLSSKPSRSHAKNATKSQLYLQSNADLPDLVRDTISEENTPVSTPTHAEFDLRIPNSRIKGGGFGESGGGMTYAGWVEITLSSPADRKAASYAYLYARRSKVQLKPSPLFDDEDDKENVPISSPLANKSKNQINTKIWRGPCPPAPRIDTGTFETSLGNPGMSFDSSTDQAADSSLEIPGPGMQASLSKDRLSGLKDVPKPKDLRGLAEWGIKSMGAVGNTPAPADYPPAPRPDTGSWSSDIDASVPRGSEMESVPRRSELPHRSRLGNSNWPEASRLDSKLTSRPSIPVPSKSGRARIGTDTGPSAGWDMGHGLSLSMISDPSTPPLGEPVPSMFASSSRAVDWADMSCERCLDELFPGAPRPLLGAWIAAGEDEGLGLGLGGPVPGATALAGPILGEHGRILGGGPRLVGAERPFGDRIRPAGPHPRSVHTTAKPSDFLTNCLCVPAVLRSGRAPLCLF